MRFQQSSTSASAACSSVTSSLLARARLQPARALVVAFRGDQRGQMQQGFAMIGLQVQDLR